MECSTRIIRGCKVSERPRYGLVTLSSVTGDVRYYGCHFGIGRCTHCIGAALLINDNIQSPIKHANNVNNPRVCIQFIPREGWGDDSVLALMKMT